jgi:hypothetical protein
VKDKDGRFVLTQKVKVDSIEKLTEVPARWPILPAGTNTAYVIDLNDDKKWQDLDVNSKKKKLDRFVKQEVRLILTLLPLLIVALIVFRTRIPGVMGPMGPPPVRPPSVSWMISLPAARFISATGQSAAKCLMQKPCMDILGMMHMI